MPVQLGVPGYNQVRVYSHPSGRYEGGPVVECPECSALVYAGARSGVAYNAGGRPNLMNRHICGVPPSPQNVPVDEPETQEGGLVPNTEGWHNNLTLPQGFAWYGYPAGPQSSGVLTIDPTRETYAAEILALFEWCEENNLTATIRNVRDRWAGAAYVRRPYFINITPQGSPGPAPAAMGAWSEAFECPACGSEHAPYTITCTEDGTPLHCSECSMTRELRDAGTAWYSVSGSIVCGSCARICMDEECESMRASNRSFCDEHGVTARCSHCGDLQEARPGEEDWREDIEGYECLCSGCLESLCSNCNRITGDLTFSSEADAYICRRCFVEVQYGPNEESFDEEAKLTAKKLRIPTIEGRENVRTCGVEIEGAAGTGNGETLAAAFHEAGISDSYGVAGYHHGNGLGFAHVERDSSVDWEAVMGPFNPADQGDMNNVNKAVRIIRGMVKDGTLGLDLRAGLHIHVGAERVSLDGAFNLNTLFAYLEDVIFRLGAARWPIHRAIQNQHYTRPIPKDLRKLEFPAAHNGEESSSARYYALSFQNYFRQMLRNCQCGAVRYDSWEECRCNLGKCTFEFRVFNTTANPRKLHAYLALTQALVAKALTMGKVTDPAQFFPAQSFVALRFKDMDEYQQESIREDWEERVAWIFSELPLTDDEKQSLLYCVRHSELETLGEDFINTLAPVEEEREEVLA